MIIGFARIPTPAGEFAGRSASITTNVNATQIGMASSAAAFSR